MRDYWIIDLRGDAVEVHRQAANSAFRLTERIERGGTLAPLVFPDISLADDVLG